MNETQIKELADIGTAAVQSAIAEYASWYFTSAICWMVLGAVCGRVGWYLCKHVDSDDEVVKVVYGIFTLVMFCVSAIIIASNIPTLLHPEAYAMHRLLCDFSGK